MESYSQCYQDLFCLYCNKFKTNGKFIEIGTNDPVNAGNNTYLLENKYNWSGLLVEFLKKFEKEYQLLRPNSDYIIGDARNIDYRTFLSNKNYPKNIDYLQIDLDVNNRSTLDVLELFDKTIFDNYKFGTVTFEHDIYTGDYFKTRLISRQIFLNRGYILVYPDVKVLVNGEFLPYEDWYCHPDLIDLSIIQKLKTNQSLTCEQIKNILI